MHCPGASTPSVCWRLRVVLRIIWDVSAHTTTQDIAVLLCVHQVVVLSYRTYHTRKILRPSSLSGTQQLATGKPLICLPFPLNGTDLYVLRWTNPYLKNTDIHQQLDVNSSSTSSESTC